MNKEIFGQFLAQTRKERNMTQQELAQQLHVTNTAVSKWERGLSYPDVSLFEPLAQVLGLSISELMACQKNAISPDDPRERSVRSLLDIVRESSRRQRRKWLLLTAFFLAAALVIGGFFYYFTVLSVHGVSFVIPIKQTGDDGSYIYLEKEDGLLKLKCEDPSLYDSIPNFRSAYYRVEYRYNKNTWEGLLLSCEELKNTLGTPLDTAGSTIILDYSVLGHENVLAETYFVRRDPLRPGRYLYSRRYYIHDPKDPSIEHTLADIKDCRSVVPTDYDKDGITELFVLTGYRNKIYRIYDLENGWVVSRFTHQVPEDITAELAALP